MGRVETIRLIFAQAGVPYEDVRIRKEDWRTKYKPNMPLEQVPVLEVDDKMLSQSTAIALYLAKKFDLNMLCMVGFFSSLFPNSTAQLTQLNYFKDRMMGLPKIKEWIETRPKTDF
ncbi:unnamed protein product [Acanthocheilonema viteae]|uniref:GST N-terminal domain-containing protein n=1 Tax=Acanthocheilonema viteae TaxID=6277 RepID=A0A498S7D5_ACAVI|nr:unnamed protein product [Acanthocheilonema viteae]